MSYEIRYFFDPGSGVCLWAKNDAARERFGYAIDHWGLPLSENTRRWLQHLVAWFDTSIDWDDPAGTAAVWSEEEWARFRQAAGRGLDRLREELPAPSFELIDEPEWSRSSAKNAKNAK